MITNKIKRFVALLLSVMLIVTSSPVSLTAFADDILNTSEVTETAEDAKEVPVPEVDDESLLEPMSIAPMSMAIGSEDNEYIYITSRDGEIEKLYVNRINGDLNHPTDARHEDIKESLYDKVIPGVGSVREIAYVDGGDSPNFIGIADNQGNNNASIGYFNVSSWELYDQANSSYNRAALAADGNGNFFYATFSSDDLFIRRAYYSNDQLYSEIIYTYEDVTLPSDVDIDNAIADMVVYNGDLYFELGKELFKISYDGNRYWSTEINGFSLSDNHRMTGLSVSNDKLIITGYGDRDKRNYAGKDFIFSGTINGVEFAQSPTYYFKDSSTNYILGATSSEVHIFNGKVIPESVEILDSDGQTTELVTLNIGFGHDDVATEALQYILLPSDSSPDTVE